MTQHLIPLHILSHLPQASEILQKARKKAPSISVSTLYCTLSMLKKEDMIRDMKFYDMDNRYDTNISNHLNLVFSARPHAILTDSACQVPEEVERMGKGIMWHGIMVRIFVFALFLFFGGAGGGFCAAEQELPCAEEIAKYCKEVKPGGGRILDCLNDHQAELSVSCRSKLEESKKKLMEARQACTGDMEKFCGDVKPGEGRIMKCLREHVQELSAACKRVAEKPGEKAQEKKEPPQ